MFLLDAVFRMQIAKDRQRDFENAATRARLLATLGRDRNDALNHRRGDLPERCRDAVRQDVPRRYAELPLAAAQGHCGSSFSCADE
jgi:hypothetical protein